MSELIIKHYGKIHLLVYLYILYACIKSCNEECSQPNTCYYTKDETGKQLFFWACIALNIPGLVKAPIYINIVLPLWLWCEGYISTLHYTWGGSKDALSLLMFPSLWAIHPSINFFHSLLSPPVQVVCDCMVYSLHSGTTVERDPAVPFLLCSVSPLYHSRLNWRRQQEH